MKSQMTQHEIMMNKALAQARKAYANGEVPIGAVLVKDGKVLAIVTHYTDDDDAPNKTVSVDLGKEGQYEIYLLDDAHDGAYIRTTDKLEFDMKVCSAVLIKEI